MILIITTTVLAIICESLVIALTIYYRKYKRIRSSAVDMLMISAATIRNIEKSIKEFNEKYDVQLSLERIEEGDDKGITLLYTDPKDESEDEKEAKHEEIRVM